MSNATAVVQFSKDIVPYEKQFSSVLPAHIPVKKFMRTVVGAIQNNPDILVCDRSTIYAACQKAAQDGLILDGREAALVKFSTACQYMPMVNGILKKLRNSGLISTITAQTVHKKDNFSYNPAMEDVPNHKPDWFGDRGEMIGVYAVAKMKDGGVVVEIMNLDQLNKVRKVSRSGNDKDGTPKGIWKQWPEEMAKKSVLRRIAKYLPSSADVDQVFEHDNENFDLDQADTTEVPKKTKTRAAEIIEAEVVDDIPISKPTDAGPDETEIDPI
tara:strand:+ start:1413 stop:2225 length:813 start_codon:yes stop_codon:yes gene_type:complete